MIQKMHAGHPADRFSSVEAVAQSTKPWLGLAVALAALSIGIFGVHIVAGPKSIPEDGKLLVDDTKGQQRPSAAQVGKNESPKTDDEPIEIANMGGFIRTPVSVAFSPSCRLAVTSENLKNYFEPTLSIWDLGRRKQVGSFGDPTKSNQLYVVWSPDEKMVASLEPRGNAPGIEFYNLANGKIVGKLQSAKFLSRDMSFSPKGQFFLAPSYEDGFVRVWNLPSLKMYREFKHGKSTATACFVDEKFVLSGGEDNVVRLWDLEGDRQEKSYEGHEKPIAVVRALAGGEKFVSISTEGQVILWEIMTGKKLSTWKLESVPGLTDHLKIVAVAPKGNRLVAGSPDGSVSVWDLKGVLVSKLDGHKKAVTAVDITPDGRFALSAGDDFTLRYFRLPTLP
jgi:WD40 repeat protein